MGYRKLNLSAVAATTATADISGKGYSTTGNITVNTGVFVEGDIFTVYNDTAGTITIVQGAGTTLRLAGTATTGTRTLAARGLCTVLAVSAAEFIVSGNVT